MPPALHSLSLNQDYPNELKAFDQWLLYRLQWNESKSKYNKIPSTINNGRLINGSKTNKAHWMSFDIALHHLEQGLGDGLGFCITPYDPFLCLDFDKCIQEPWCFEAIKNFDSAAELSVSKEGCHIFIEAEKPGGMGTKSKTFHNSKVEILGNGQFVALTGEFNGKPVANRQSLLLEFAAPLQKQKEKISVQAKQSEYSETASSVLEKLKQSRFAESFTKLFEGGNLSDDTSADDLVFCNYLASFTADPNVIDEIYRQSNRYRDKWDQKRGQHTYGELTIEQALSASNPLFKQSATEAFAGMAVPQQKPNPPVPKNVFSLEKFVVNKQLDELKQKTLEDKFVLPKVAILGQLTALYAPPNSGKTLLTIYQLIESIRSGNIDGSQVFYFNCDDSYNGMLIKATILNEHRVNCIFPDHNGFKLNDFPSYLNEMINSDATSGMILILDTLKKFTDIMHKTRSSDFNALARRFTQKGGSIIALAHTNKNKSEDGRLVVAGTSDVVDDFDCAFVINTLDTNDPETKTVQFENIKQRGNVSRKLTFSYATQEGINYYDLLDSVTCLDERITKQREVEAKVKSDAELIDIICQNIRSGNVKRTELINASHKESKSFASRKEVERVLDQYTGDDYSHGDRWLLKIGDKNSHTYTLLTPKLPTP
tara:strand:- start:115 stop:2079 length:1965 start_codon:yes stop_codon:yes gene_type:complete